MHECTSIIINSFHLFQRTLFNKGFDVGGERGVFKEPMKTNRGRGVVKPFSMLTLLKKFPDFSNSNRVPSNKLLGSC